MEKDFNTGLRKGIEADRVRLTHRRRQLLREMGYSEDLDSTELAEKLHEQALQEAIRDDKAEGRGREGCRC